MQEVERSRRPEPRAKQEPEPRAKVLNLVPPCRSGKGGNNRRRQAEKHASRSAQIRCLKRDGCELNQQ